MSENRSNTQVLGRALAVWLMIIIGETLHGTVRTLAVEPFVEPFRARQIAVFTGAAVFLAITALFVKWLRAETAAHHLAIGALWVVLTVTFEVILGRFALGMAWERLLSDYDLSKGGLLPIGLTLLLLAPYITAKFRRLI